MYLLAWLDTIHYKIREDGRYQSKAVFPVFSLALDGKKESLSLYLSENEGANFWLSVLTELQNRGVNDILIACVDGLMGFPEAINNIYPIQKSRCSSSTRSATQLNMLPQRTTQGVYG